MTQLTRIGSYLILLLGLLLAAQAMNGWLQRQTQVQVRLLNDDAIALKRAQFTQVAEKLQLGAASPEKDFADAGHAIGATLYRGEPPATIPAAGLLSFSERLPADGRPGPDILVCFPLPSSTRVIALYHRVTLGLFLLCPVLFAAGLLLATLARRRGEDRSSRPPWTSTRTQALGIEHFAKITNERTVALAQEHGARVRAEEDLQANRTLLDQSLGERVRLGRELHDNICQTLYAVCLTLESVQKKNALVPELQQRLGHCMAELRRLNREVRSFLQELEPARMSSQSFTGALAVVVGSFAAEEGVRIEQRLDEEAVALIPPQHIAEIMNILREAVSNSLRHGRARHVILRAGRSDLQVALAVQDDGTGFAATAPRAATGHGLANMQARAAALGGTLQIESAPGKGTRVLLTLAVASPA